MSALAHSPLSVCTHHKVRKIPNFCTKKYGRLHLNDPHVRTGQTLMSLLGKPLSPDCGRLLWTALRGFSNVHVHVCSVLTRILRL